MRDLGPWPYLVPYLAFGVVLALADSLSASWAPALALAQVAVPGIALLAFARARAYPELGGAGWSAGGVAGDLGVGIAIGIFWMAPFVLVEGLPRPGPEAAFDTERLGSAAATLAVRALGFALVTPFMEELFVRSFLMRAIDAWSGREDFRELPIGRFAWPSFLGTVIWFTVTHQTWEWVVALPAGIAFNLWLYQRRSLPALVLCHAAANATIFVTVVLLGPDRPELWIFL